MGEILGFKVTVGMGLTPGKRPERRLFSPPDNLWLDRMIIIRKMMPRKIRIIRFDNIRGL